MDRTTELEVASTAETVDYSSLERRFGARALAYPLKNKQLPAFSDPVNEVTLLSDAPDRSAHSVTWKITKSNGRMSAILNDQIEIGSLATDKEKLSGTCKELRDEADVFTEENGFTSQTRRLFYLDRACTQVNGAQMSVNAPKGPQEDQQKKHSIRFKPRFSAATLDLILEDEPHLEVNIPTDAYFNESLTNIRLLINQISNVLGLTIYPKLEYIFKTSQAENKK